MIKLSLVIATYNRSTELVKTLGSVVGQTCPSQEWECIVVNNNSSDDTAEAFARFAAAHADVNLRMIDEPQQGLSYARNCGIAAAGGEYVAIIDDDETIAPEFIAAYISLFEHHDDAMAAGGPVIAVYDNKRPSWLSSITERPIANQMNFGKRVRRFPSHRVPAGGNMAFRRAIYMLYGGFNTDLGRVGKQLLGGEENDFFHRLASVGEKVYYAPEAVMYHHIADSKLSREYFEQLNYQIGVSKMRRAKLYDRVGALRTDERVKRVVTVLLCLWYTVTLRPSKGVWLWRMRNAISRGIADAAKPQKR